MKKLVAILAIVLFAGSTAFAAVHDNTTVNKSGTGTFKCTIIEPLKIEFFAPSGSVSTQIVDLGEFVVNTALAYNAVSPEDWSMTFKVTGNASHAFNYVITETESAKVGTTEIASATIDWFAGETSAPTVSTVLDKNSALSAGGEFYIKATLKDLYAKSTGVASFLQTVTVKYITL